MSERWVKLVAGLTPTGPRYTEKIQAAMRDRFVLLVLAYLADEDGTCQVSLTTLSSITLTDPKYVKQSIRAAEEHGFVVRTERTGSQVNTYRLMSSPLKAAQVTKELRDRDSVEQLEAWGVLRRTIRTLEREGIETMDQLGELIGKYTELPIDDQTGFDKFLSIKQIGPTVAQRVLDAFAAWHAALQ